MAAFISFEPKDYFKNQNYTGNSSSAEIPVTGVGFQPDVVWAKNRNATYDNFIFDSVRTATNYVRSNTNAIEGTNAQTLKSFDSDGYTMGTDSDVNQSTSSFASYSWKAGTTSGIATDGSTTITPSAYSFDQTRGISIIKYSGNGSSGAQLAHGLGVKPSLCMVKRLDVTENWAVYHKNMSNTLVTTNTDFDTDAQDYYAQLDTYAARGDSTNWWHYTAPTSVNMYLGNDDAVNNSGGTYIAYVFAEKNGFSKFHGHKGNSSADGVFLYTGFRPAWLMVKRIDSGSEDWNIWNSKNLGYNIDNNKLYANLNNIESTADEIDLVSNGWKIRISGGGVNDSSGTYIWAAFSEFPIVSSNDVPGVAR